MRSLQQKAGKKYKKMWINGVLYHVKWWDDSLLKFSVYSSIKL